MAKVRAADGPAIPLPGGDQKEFRVIPIGVVTHSRFNTRKSRTTEQIQRLAERISRNGFEPTRAPWVTPTGDGQYEVFAGGTRTEAARQAGLEEIPCFIHTGLTDDQISCLADIDNENDEYHVEVGAVDVWAEYARLRDAEGWTQQRIAEAKGATQQTVSFRLQLHGLPDKVKRFTLHGDLTEAHLREITALRFEAYLSAWLTTEGAWIELAEAVVEGKSKNGSKSVAAVREDVKGWKEFIARAEELYESFSSDVTFYDFVGEEGQEKAIECSFDAKAAFIAELVAQAARSLIAVQSAGDEILTRISDNLAEYNDWLQGKQRDAEKRRKLLAKVHQGDCLQALADWGDRPKIRLLLTDPPYGQEYQSNRRWATKAAAPIAGDGKEEAAGLLGQMLQAVAPHLAEEAHLLVFCGWAAEPEFRRVVEDAGFTLRGSLIWVKEQGGSGDVKGAFKPRHERIIHATKGAPEVKPRIDDVQEAVNPARGKESLHPMEKPVELLEKLILSTTTTGEKGMVVDPFAGSGSTLVAAFNLKREFWGAEVDAEHHQKASERLLRAAFGEEEVDDVDS